MSRRGQRGGFAAGMDPDRPALTNLITSRETVSEQRVDPDRTARVRGLVWIHAGRGPIVLVLS